VLADIQPGSAALILTDPPYAGSYEEEYAALGAFAAEKLVRGGSLVCYVGQRTLPFALRRLAEHLDYFWCLALVQRGGIQQLRMGVRCGWKPVLWFTNGRRRGRENVYDVLAGSPPSKELHEWAQGVDEVMPVIEMLTDPGELVLDPFAGSGSFGVAASKLGRRLIGATL
jgi:DNA modification methylase